MVECWVCLKAAIDDIFKGDTLHKLSFCLGFTIAKMDDTPSGICQECHSNLNNAYAFRRKCLASYKKFRRSIEKKEDATWNAELTMCDDSDNSDIEKETSKNADPINDRLTDEHVVVDLKNSKESTYEENSATAKKYKKKNILKNNTENSNASKPRRKNINKPVLIAKNDDSIPIKGRKYMCTVCGKTFLCQVNLADHERIHSGDRPFKCTVCERSFAQAGHLMVHRRTHSGIKPYKCDACPRAFTVSHTLKKHLRTHTGERPYRCKLCNKSFVTSYHLSNHHKRHVGDKTFKCDWAGCQRSYINVSEMKRHRARHCATTAGSLTKRPRSHAAERLKSIECVPIVQLEKLSGGRFVNVEMRQPSPKEYHLTKVAMGYL